MSSGWPASADSTMNFRKAASCGELRNVGLLTARSKAPRTSLLLGGPSLFRPKVTTVTPRAHPAPADTDYWSQIRRKKETDPFAYEPSQSSAKLAVFAVFGNEASCWQSNYRPGRFATWLTPALDGCLSTHCPASRKLAGIGKNAGGNGFRLFSGT